MKVLVVGAGAAGLFAAYSAATHTEAKVTVAEKNEKAGKKNLHNGQGKMQPHQPVHAARIS